MLQKVLMKFEWGHGK